MKWWAFEKKSNASILGKQNTTTQKTPKDMRLTFDLARCLVNTLSRMRQYCANNESDHNFATRPFALSVTDHKSNSFTMASITLMTLWVLYTKQETKLQRQLGFDMGNELVRIYSKKSFLYDAEDLVLRWSHIITSVIETRRFMQTIAISKALMICDHCFE